MAMLAFAAAFTLGLTGYGFGLVAMAGLPFVLSVAEASAFVVPLALNVTVVAWIPLRNEVHASFLWPVIVGAVVGVPLGVIYLVQLNDTVLRVSLAAGILSGRAGSVLMSLRSRRASRRSASHGSASRGRGGRVVAIVIGALSGSLGGAFSVSGPPVAFYFAEVFSNKITMKAHLLAYFMVVMTIRLPLLAVSGVYTLSLLLLIAGALPIVGAGLWAGTVLHRRLPADVVRGVVQALLAASAVLMIVRA